MWTVSRPGVTEGDAVSLDLDGIFEVVPARIVAFLGPVALLRPGLVFSGSYANRLAAGVNGLLVVVNHGRLHALGGDVKVTGEYLAMRLTDDFRLGQRRHWSRASVRLDARLVPLDGEPVPVLTHTTDVSPGGAQVVWPADRPVRASYEVVLSTPGLRDPIRAEAVPSRSADGHLGLRFTRIDPSDRRRLVELVLLVLDRRVSRPARLDPAPERPEAEAPAPSAPVAAPGPAADPIVDWEFELGPEPARVEVAYSDPWERSAGARTT